MSGNQSNGASEDVRDRVQGISSVATDSPQNVRASHKRQGGDRRFMLSGSDLAEKVNHVLGDVVFGGKVAVVLCDGSPFSSHKAVIISNREYEALLDFRSRVTELVELGI
jgi:hypothetical protein